MIFLRLVLLLIVAVGCVRSLTYDRAMERNQFKFYEENRGEEVRFITYLISATEFIEEISELAATKAYAAAVKEYCKETDELTERLNLRIEGFAISEGIFRPISLSGEHLTKLNNLRNTEKDAFDQQYLDYVVDVNNRITTKLDYFALNAVDDDVRGFCAEHVKIYRNMVEDANSLKQDSLLIRNAR